MDFSKLKIELYDFFGILIPGTILVSECVLAVSGWQRSIAILSALPGNLLAAFLATSYIAGHLVQEAGDLLVRLLSPARHLKRARDIFWISTDGEQVKKAIKHELGFDITSVDVAYDYCLSKSKEKFTRRDAFIATSDLARSIVFLTIPTSFAVIMALVKQGLRGSPLFLLILCLATGSVVIFYLSWRRMMRFRQFSDLPVFAAYLAATSSSPEVASRESDKA